MVTFETKGWKCFRHNQHTFNFMFAFIALCACFFLFSWAFRTFFSISMFLFINLFIYLYLFIYFWRGWWYNTSMKITGVIRGSRGRRVGEWRVRTPQPPEKFKYSHSKITKGKLQQPQQTKLFLRPLSPGNIFRIRAWA